MRQLTASHQQIYKAKCNAKLDPLSSTYDPAFAVDYTERSDGQWDAPPRDTEIFKEVGLLSTSGEGNLWRDLSEAFDTDRPDCVIASLVDNAPSAVAFDTEFTGKTLTCFGWTNGKADGDHDEVRCVNLFPDRADKGVACLEALLPESSYLIVHHPHGQNITIKSDDLDSKLVNELLKDHTSALSLTSKKTFNILKLMQIARQDHMHRHDDIVLTPQYHATTIVS